MPKVVCHGCENDFKILRNFMVKLNEGQALLAEKLSQVDNMIIQMPNLLADKRCLFRDKYPCIPKAVKPRLAKPRKPLPVLHLLSEKRSRKLPRRLAESIQGFDLDNIFVKEESKQEVDDPHDQAQLSVSPPVTKPSMEPSRRYQGRQRNKCDICQKTFKLQGRLAHHRSTVHRGAYFQCTDDNCGKQYKTRESINLHQKMNKHSSMQLIEPGKLLESGSTETDQLTVPSSSLTCTDCGRSFKSKSLLQRHLSVVHSESRPYACDHCPLTFKSATNLRAHQVTHTGERKYACDHCGKLFGYKTSLIQHIKLHEENGKSFACPHCQKKFTQKGNLEEHIRIHTGEKPFACTVCDRKFTTSSQWKMHEKRHKGEKPWQCSQCPKAFLHKESFKAHTRRHKGEKPYGCPLCSKAFTEVWALKKHQRLHTGEKPYKCQDCGKAFSDCSNLSKHSKTHLRAGDEITAKDGTVWNIINQTSTTGQDQETSSAGQNDDVQQIIYIAYDNEETAENDNKQSSVHIISQTETVPETTALPIFSSRVDQGSSQTSTPDVGEEAVNHSVAPESSTFHVISQEAAGLDPNSQYVDLSIRDGQHVRLKVPLDADPMVYAKEYLQSLSMSIDNSSSPSS